MRPAADDRLSFAFVVLSSFAIELLLINRKFGILRGGFGQPEALQAVADISLFCAATIAAQILVLGLVYAATARVFPRPRECAERILTFAFFGLGGFLTVLNIRLELALYFSDAVSFQLFKNLGGGSLVTALLYGIPEGFTPAALATLGFGLYLTALGILRRLPDAKRLHHPPWGIPKSSVYLMICITLGMCFWTNQRSPINKAANQMTAFAGLTRLLQDATDFDRDGYGLFSDPIDRHPFDPRRHPYGVEVPNNGADDDQLAGDLININLPQKRQMPALPRKKRHVVLIVLESTRFDALGKRIHGQPVMPNLEDIARHGSAFPNAFSHAGFTTPSVTSLLTGTLIPRPEDGSLYCDLRRSGYRVGVFSTMDEDFGGIADATGSKRCADLFFDARLLRDERAFAFASTGSLVVDERKLFDRFITRLGQRADWQRPNFIYFNFQSPHFPYFHPGMTRRITRHPLPRDAITPARRNGLVLSYYNAVAYADQWIGAIRDHLKAVGAWDNTLLVVTADHGESLFENDFLGHGFQINAAQLHIPLVFSQPGLGQRGPVGLEDVRWQIGDALAGRKPRQSQTPSFHYTGDFDRPTLIGHRQIDGTFTIFDFADRTVRFSQTGRRQAYDTLAPHSRQRARADALIHEWERRRWAARTSTLSR